MEVLELTKDSKTSAARFAGLFDELLIQDAEVSCSANHSSGNAALFGSASTAETVSHFIQT